MPALSSSLISGARRQSPTPATAFIVSENLPAVMPAAPHLTAPPLLPAGVPADPLESLPPRVRAYLPNGVPPRAAGQLARAFAGKVPQQTKENKESEALPDPADARQVVAAHAGQLPVPGTWDEAECAALLAFLSQVSDKRDPRGRRHRLTYVLAITVLAMFAGDTHPTAIAEWAADAPTGLLIRLGGQTTDENLIRPDATTISRVLAEGIDGDELDSALCAYTAAIRRRLHGGLLTRIDVDGKADNGATRKRKGLKAPMRLAARCDAGTVLAQLAVSEKTNEIPVFPKLLDLITSIVNVVITADQLHTQREHANYLHKRDAFYVFTLGGNQPNLYDAVDQLPWKQIAVEHATVDRGHGRIELRTIKTLPATQKIRDLFPHTEQVFLLERYIFDLDGNPQTPVAVLGITSPPPRRAGHTPAGGPAADGADLMAYLRGHWSIEVLHWIRDVTFGEDTNRTRGASRALAGLANLTISVLTLRGVTNIAKQLRANHRDPYRLPLIHLGLTTGLP